MHDEKEGEEEPPGMADALMKRGELLRYLRELERADGLERRQQQHDEESTLSTTPTAIDQIDVLPTTKNHHHHHLTTVLRYESYLNHQRYHDDLKHVDCDFIDFQNLIIQQDKSLGKGGLCWDAAHILAEHLIHTQNDWTAKALTTTSAHQPTRIIELGAGTGLCGLMLAKAATNCHVTITDLPELLPLMQRNVVLNFGGSDPDDSKYCSLDDACWRVLLQDRQEQTHRHRASSLGTADVAARVLRWGVEQDYSHVKTFDVVLGADVVASLYDPLLLAQTIHSLCHDKSMVYVSYKGRLTGPHKQFQAALLELFERVEVLRPHPNCRNRNPDVFILKAEHKKRDVYEPKK